MRTKLERLGFSGDPNLHQLLSAAVNALENANFLLQEQQNDAAFQYYLDAYEIAVNIIPGHTEYAFTARTDATWNSQFANVLKVIQSMETAMKELKQTLDDQASSPRAAAQSGTTTTLSPGVAQLQGQRLVSIAARDTAAELELMRNPADPSANTQEPSLSITQESSSHRPLPTPPSSSPDKR
ncbi:Vacuolar protein-sorting-associated protein 27, partial [Ascosphaera pollenicola]